MSAEHSPYNQLFITAWTFLSIVLGVAFLGMFIFGDQLLEIGHITWSLIRWLARPLI